MSKPTALSLAALTSLTLACGAPEDADVGERASALGSLAQVAYRSPADLTASTGNLYWTHNAIDEFGPDVSAVYRASKDSTPGAEIPLYQESGDWNGYRTFGSLAYANVGAWYGYFLASYQDFSTGVNTTYVKRIPLAGGAAVTLGASPAFAGARDLVTDGVQLFWADQGGLRRMPIGGGFVSTLASSALITQVSLDASYVYYGDNAQIRRVPKGGGTVSVLATGGGVITALHVDSAASTRVFWGESSGAVRSLTVGGAVVVHQSPAAGRTVTSVGFDGSRVLWSDCSQVGNACRVSKRQGFLTTTITSNQVGAGRLQWDASRMFYGTAGGLFKYTH